MTPRAALFGALFRAGTAVFSILFPRLGPWFSAFSLSCVHFQKKYLRITKAVHFVFIVHKEQVHIRLLKRKRTI
jgi:hypothetical protein